MFPNVLFHVRLVIIVVQVCVLPVANVLHVALMVEIWSLMKT